MKKIIALILVCLFFICGCSKKISMEVYTSVLEEENSFISINYPVFNNNKLNTYIKKDVDKIINNFNLIELNENNKELNIDYIYKLVNENYISVAITCSIYNSDKNLEEENIFTYVFDYKNNKLLNLKDILNDYSGIDTSDKFILSSNSIIFYTVENNKIREITKDLDKLNLNFKINRIQETNIPFKYETVNKVIDPNKPIVALTFDDGPSQHTKDIMNLLKDNNCNATFFVLGNKVKYYSETIKEILNNGNEIGNHTYNHKWLSRLNIESIKEQINKTQQLIVDITGYTPTLLRPTYGSVNNKIRNNTNLDIVLWNIDTLDWKIKDSKKIANRAIQKVEDGSIILMHDTYKRSFDALKIIIPKLKEKNYQFVTVSELKEIKKIRDKSV